MLRQRLLQFFPEAGVKIGIIVQQNSVSINPPDHSIGVAVLFITVPGNQDNLCLEMILQFNNHIPVELHRVLLNDFIGHYNLVAAFDHIAAVQNNIRGNAIQLQVLADGGIVWNEVLESLQVIRSVSVEQELVLLQLNGHIVPRPDVLLGNSQRKELSFNIPAA